MMTEAGYSYKSMMKVTSVLVVFLLQLSGAISRSITCPRSCDCKYVTRDGYNRHLAVTCFVMDVKDVNMYDLFTIEEEYSLTVNCDSGIPIDLEDHMFGYHPSMRAITFNNCKISFVYKLAFAGLQNIQEIAIHTASNLHLQFHPNSLDETTKLSVLELTHSGILTIPKLCNLHDLKVLNVTGNSLVSFNISGLACGENDLRDLRTLDISDNYFQNLDELAIFGHAFKNLEIINAAGNDIMFTADDDSFKHFTELTAVDMSHNNIGVLPETLLSKNKNVQDIRLSNNQIQTIPDDFFLSSGKALQLELQNNNLDDTVWICLSNLKRLLYLDVSTNKLTFLNQTALERLRDLVYLHIEDNSIAGIPVRTFQNHQRLHTLNLAGNHIQTIDNEALFGLFYLNRLELQRNGIFSIGTDFLNSATALNFMNLSSNYLTDLPSFEKLGGLIVIDASNNNIGELYERTFIGQRKVRYINLSDNRIGELPDSIFLSCNSLEVLDLSMNAVHYLHPALFIGLNIRTLHLQRNRLEAIGSTFSNLKRLQELNLSSNDISDTIQRYTFPKSLEMLDLSYNKIETVRSFAFDGLDHIRMVDLRYNRIQTLTKEALRVSTSMYSQTGFRISDNPLQCDCQLSWLNKWDQSTHGPIIVNLNGTLCNGAYDYPQSPVKLVPVDRFLCQYESVCDETCRCCGFTACDCKYSCPTDCECYHSSDLVTTHYVKCSNPNITSIDKYIPRIASGVDYSGSDISIIPSAIFIGMSNLKTLLLNHTSLETIIDNNSFTGLKSLRVLYIDNNLLRNLNEATFRGLNNLQELYIDHNRIASISDGLFNELTSLKILTLSHNHLTYMTEYLSTIVFSNIHVYMHSNPWICDCILYFSARERAYAFVPTSGVTRTGNRYLAAHRRSTSNHILCSNGINPLTDIMDYAKICETGDYKPVTPSYAEELSAATVTDVKVAADDNGQSESHVRDIAVAQKEMSNDVWNERVKIFLPAIIAGTIVFIVIILIVCRHEFIKCWLHFKYRGKSDSLDLLDDKGRYFDAFVAYHPRDELYVVRELAMCLERGDPKYLLQLQHRDHPPATSDLTYIDTCVKSSHRTIVVLSGDFINDNSLLKCVTQAVRHDSMNRLIVITLGKIDSSKVDPILQHNLKQGRRISFGERLFWDKLYYCLPDPSKVDRDTERAEAHPYACTDLARLSSAMMDNRAYEEPSSGNLRPLPTMYEYNMPSTHGYGYGGSQNSSNIYEEIKDQIQQENISVKYAEPWRESDMHDHVQTLTRGSRIESETESTSSPDTGYIEL